MTDPRLTIKHLTMMHAIANAGSMTRAAELLNISQPALSSRLSDAEAILGTRLFVRRGKRLTISAPGQLLLRSASSILEELSKIENLLLNLPDQAGQALRIGVPQYASYGWLPMAIKSFETRFPSVTLEIVSGATLQPRSALIQNQVDIALVSSPKRVIQVDKSRFRCRRLFEDEFVALLPANHARAGRACLVAEDFLSETYITNSAVPQKNREYELFFHPQAVSPERVVQVGVTEAVLELVAAGIGTTIMTRWIMESLGLRDSLVSLPLTKQGLRLHWFALSSHRKEIDEQAMLLSDLIVTHRETAKSA
ncbi:MAG: LysR family transcriptional regulator [Pseudomonadota bacterium]